MNRFLNNLMLVAGAADGMGEAESESFAKKGAYVLTTGIYDDLSVISVPYGRSLGNCIGHCYLVSDESSL